MVLFDVHCYEVFIALSCELNVAAISYCCLFCDDVNR